MILFPNAKINLGLNVTAKRIDGYHNIETVFLPVPLCDVLEFVESQEKKTRLTLTGATLEGNQEENLVVKAWKIMQENFNIPPVDIHLHKIIPAGAGLGGGSSDAAFMLKGLNEFFKCGANTNELEKYASILGSDCAFFIQNTPAYAEGRGNILKPVSISLENCKILLVNPAIHVSTRDAYSGVRPLLPKVSLKQTIMLDKKEWQAQVKNDFEGPVFFKFPAIASIKAELISAGAFYASMSGSGSTVYGIFSNDIDLQPVISSYTRYFVWRGRLKEN